MISPSFFRGCRNFYGALPEPMISRLQAVIDSPNQRTWNDAYSIIVGADGWMTLWQAVLEVDSSFPRVGTSQDLQGRILRPWPRVPDSFTLCRAIRYARTFTGSARRTAGE